MSNEGSFIRKGVAGGVKVEFQEYPDLEREFKNWIQQKKEEYKISFF